MAYSAATLNLIAGRAAGGNSPGIYHYTTSDAHATVSGAEYFENSHKSGLRVNDLVVVVDTNVGTVTLHRVVSVDSDADVYTEPRNHATLSAATLA